MTFFFKERYPFLNNVLFNMVILKIDILLFLATPMVISGNCRCFWTSVPWPPRDPCEASVGSWPLGHACITTPVGFGWLWICTCFWSFIVCSDGSFRVCSAVDSFRLIASRHWKKPYAASHTKKHTQRNTRQLRARRITRLTPRDLTFLVDVETE